MVQNLYAGNALRLFLQPPAGAVKWRILRKASDTFTDQNDPTALNVYEGDDLVVVDAESLTNEVMAFYRPFYFNGTAWTAGATNTGTPTASYQDFSTDVLSFMRDRLERGLLIELQRGNLINDLGYIQVYTSPPSIERDLRFPLVTLHLESESPSVRAIGENISGDEFDDVGFQWNESEGWLADVQLSIVGWSLNSDERIELRKAIRRLVIANLPVLQSRGFDLVSLTQNDVDSINGEFNAPIYQVINNFSCVAPVRVGERINPITDVISSVTVP
jgi:hypothetical protein